MAPLQVTIMALVAVGALPIVFVRDLVRLAIVSSAYSLLLVVGTVGFPLVILAAIIRDRAGE